MLEREGGGPLLDGAEGLWMDAIKVQCNVMSCNVMSTECTVLYCTVLYGTVLYCTIL